MKRIVLFILGFALFLSLVACGTGGKDLGSSTSSGPLDLESPDSEEGNTNARNASVSSFDLVSGENGKAPTVLLNSGYEMPIAGVGTYSLTDNVCVDSVTAALEHGVRLIDTAYMYHNEKAVGEAVRKSGIPREEIFVTTKLYPSQFDNAAEAIDKALEKLDIGYIDLMLLHHPGEGDVGAYKAMEPAVKDGKVRSIGLSN